MTPSQAVDKLAFITVAGSQAGSLRERLLQDDFYVTQVDSSGGLLYEATVSMLIGLEGRRLARLLAHVRECCHSRRQFLPVHAEAPFIEWQPVMIEAEVGGATIYVFDVERFEQI
jgi:uncharacterized protein YaaQ